MWATDSRYLDNRALHPPFSVNAHPHLIRPQDHPGLFHKMTRPLLLASTSAIRLTLLQNAGLSVTAHAARIDEDTARQSLQAEGATPQDVADALAEMKAVKLADRHPQHLILGCDQVLDANHQIFRKPKTPDEARDQLLALRGKTHRLLSAAVLYDQGQPIWRHVGIARLTMRDFSESYLTDYLHRNWPAVSQSVGSYLLEAEGVRLFDKIDGDYFTILGLPLLPLLSYLGLRGFIAS
jgi:septum formation protein